MLVKLTEVCQNGALTTKQDYTLRDVFINPEHVIMIREEARMQNLNEQGLLPAGLEQNIGSQNLRLTEATLAQKSL